MHCAKRFSHLIHRRFHMLCGNPPTFVAWQADRRCRAGPLLGPVVGSEAPRQLRLANSARSTSEPRPSFCSRRVLSVLTVLLRKSFSPMALFE